MYLFLCIFAPGALTFLIAEKCSGTKKTADWLRSIMELMVYAAINTVLTAVLLKPFGRFEMVVTAEGSRTICYGITTLAVALIVSILSGIVMAAIKKNVDIKMQIVSREEVSGEKQKKS